jgi:hypothetical protein
MVSTGPSPLEPIAMLFEDELYDEFGTWPLAYIPYGGADFGEISAVAKAIGGGDDSASAGINRHVVGDARALQERK